MGRKLTRLRKLKRKSRRKTVKGGGNPAWLLPLSLQGLNLSYKPKSKQNKTRKRRHLLSRLNR